MNNANHTPGSTAPSLLITICARGGSKGIPGKNVRQLAGKPLIQYTTETAQKLMARWPGQRHLALSTDSDEIKQAAAHAGLHTSYTRPDEHATDSAGKLVTIRHLLMHEEAAAGRRFDYVLDLDVTSPMRTVADLEAAFALLETHPTAHNLYSVNPAARNPYFNMVEALPDGTFATPRDGGLFLTRQSAPDVYDLNASFYYYRRSFFEDGESLRVISPRGIVYVMPHMCFDLDHPVDFEFMEYLVSNEKLGFEL